NSTFSVYGDVTFTQLAAMATIKLTGQNFGNGIGPAVSNGQCDPLTQTNWGSPTSPAGPCGNYFPIIYINGDAQINGNEGQGILLVNGGLNVQGGCQFYGLTVVRAAVETACGRGRRAKVGSRLARQ